MATRKPEQKVFDSLKIANKSRLLLHRVENIVRNSMPDIIGINSQGTSFWLELKHVDKWPKFGSTPVIHRHKFQPGQLAFLSEWVNGWHGKAFLLVRVGSDDLLLSPDMEIPEWNTNRIQFECVARGLPQIIQYLESL